MIVRTGVYDVCLALGKTAAKIATKSRMRLMMSDATDELQHELAKVSRLYEAD